MQPFADSTAIQCDAARIRARADADGYLLIRGLLPREDVESVGEALGTKMADAGWIPPGLPLREAPANPDKRCVEPQPAFMEVCYLQHSLKCVHALKMHPRLMAFFGTLFGEEALCAPHFDIRVMFPEMEAYATPAHQDYVHLEGSRRGWAVWIPFVPITEESGGIEYAAGSHAGGAYDMRPALGAGLMALDAELEGFDWRWSPMEPGDVLFHNVLTVHRGLPNRARTLRVSMDSRYLPLSEPVGEKYLGVTQQLTTWDTLYQGWDGEEYKYYWRNMDLEVVPFTYHWYDRRDEKAIEMGEAGEPEALLALESIAHKHRDPSMRERAGRALEKLRAQ